ncbi:MAG: hypothetical protein JWM73_2997 [Solirubrobacterales bacterium]|jgi:hypothetical protein|nr:hypothetical protein [Solirubrobacterales bacterium]
MDAQHHNHQTAFSVALKLMMAASAAFVTLLPVVMH